MFRSSITFRSVSVILSFLSISTASFLTVFAGEPSPTRKPDCIAVVVRALVTTQEKNKAPVRDLEWAAKTQLPSDWHIEIVDLIDGSGMTLHGMTALVHNIQKRGRFRPRPDYLEAILREVKDIPPGSARKAVFFRGPADFSGPIEQSKNRDWENLFIGVSGSSTIGYALSPEANSAVLRAFFGPEAVELIPHYGILTPEDIANGLTNNKRFVQIPSSEFPMSYLAHGGDLGPLSFSYHDLYHAFETSHFFGVNYRPFTKRWFDLLTNPPEVKVKRRGQPETTLKIDAPLSGLNKLLDGELSTRFGIAEIISSDLYWSSDGLHSKNGWALILSDWISNPEVYSQNVDLKTQFRNLKKNAPGSFEKLEAAFPKLRTLVIE